MATTPPKPSFSVVLIARNEEKTLPRLVKSLAEFQARGGEIIVVDTGSTDGTAALAASLGCQVFAVGDTFLTKVSHQLANDVNVKFLVDNEAPILWPGETLFDYAAARNYAAFRASNEFVAMPDCDEQYTALNLDAIEREIAKGASQFEYNFVFAHDEFGNETIKFLHSKFYDRRKYRWVGVVHEVLQGSGPIHRFPESLIKLEHWQNPETNRTGYLRGLALDCFQNPDNDRNSHYFARELLYSGRYKSAIKEFERHVAMNRWPLEAGQSLTFIGDCYRYLGDEKKAVDYWHRSFLHTSSRREPLLRLAEFYWRKNEPQRVAAYASAALTISKSANYYANNAADDTYLPHEMLYWAHWYLGNKAEAKTHWEKALAYSPQNKKFLHDARFFKEMK